MSSFLGLRRQERYSSLSEASPVIGLLNRAGKLREDHGALHRPGASQAGPEGARCLRWHLFSASHLCLRFPLQKDALAAEEPPVAEAGLRCSKGGCP